MKIFVTGADGFIGSSLVKRILETTDWTVVGMDLGCFRLEPLLSHPRFAFRQGDMTVDQTWVDQQIQACDVVLPLAACALPSQYINDPLAVFELDFEENLRIVRECFKRGKRIIFPSTSEVYGMCQDENFNEQTSPLVLGPISKQRWIYSCGKQMLDRVIWAYGLKGLQFTLFRPFNWFGPNLDNIQNSGKGQARVITQFLGNLLRDEPIHLVDGGSQHRCFTYLDDGIEALIRIIENSNGVADSQIFNIGNPRNDFSIGELAQHLVTTLSEFPGWEHIQLTHKIEIESSNKYYGEGYQDVQFRRPDITLARTLLRWEPSVSMDEGLSKTVQFYLQQIESSKPVHPPSNVPVTVH